MRRKDRQVTDRNGVEEIIGMCKTCRLAMVDDGMPYVVPLSFGYEFAGEKLILYFHCAREGRKIDILHKNNKVCFEMDCEGEPLHSEIPCNCGYYFSSVIGFGQVEFIEDVSEKSRALSFMFEHQTGKKYEFSREQAGGICVFQVVSDDFTGKRKE